MTRHGRRPTGPETDDEPTEQSDVDRTPDPTTEGAEPAGTGAAERSEAGRRARRPGEGRLDFLYRGNGGLDVIGRSRTWYLWSAALVVVCIGFMLIRGFNIGIDFQGGTSVSFPAQGANGPISVIRAEETFSSALGRGPTSVQVVGAGPTATVQVRSSTLDQGEITALRAAVAEQLKPLNAAGAVDPAVVSDSAVSASWGGEITRQAIIALAVFLVLVTIYLTFYFDLRMAIASLATLLFDMVVTAGVYSMVGFEVSPATVIGLLTVLGFSLYDTVIVFDKVRENTRGLLSLTRRTYGEAANLAVCQTLMRSFNTSLTSALPLIGLLVIGVGLLGVGVLGDLALVQLVGTVVGIGSSVIVATPLVVTMVERDPRWIEQARKVANRRAKDRARRDAGPGLAGSPGGATAAGSSDTDALDTRAVAAAAGGGRGGVGAPSSRGGPGRGPRPGARPSGKANRPTGKRRRS